MDTAFWPFLRQLVLFVIGDYIFISMREYYNHAALHRYNAEVRTEFIRNVLDQEADFIHLERHSAGFAHLMNRETTRMQKVVNQSLQRFVFALISTLGGLFTLYSVDARLALLGLLVKSPLQAAIWNLSRKDIVKYSKLYDASCGEAARIATSILRPEVIHLLQSHVAQNNLVDLYKAKQQEFIHYLEYTHVRQTFLCMVNHGLRNAEDVLLTAIGLSSVLKGKITLGTFLAFRQQLNLVNDGPKEFLTLWNDMLNIRMTAADYFELLYRESNIPCSSDGNNSYGQKLHSMKGLTMSLKGVSFSYRLNPDVKVLDSIDLCLRPGKVVALIGGSGKSFIFLIIL